MATDPKSTDELKRIYREIAGVNPSLANVPLMDEEDQRVFIAKTLQALMTRTHPMVLMTMLIVALGYLSDEHSVDREHLVKLTMTLAADIKPGGVS